MSATTLSQIHLSAASTFNAFLELIGMKAIDFSGSSDLHNPAMAATCRRLTYLGTFFRSYLVSTSSTLAFGLATLEIFLFHKSMFCNTFYKKMKYNGVCTR